MRPERMLNRNRVTKVIAAGLAGAVAGYLLWGVLDRADPASSALLRGLLPALGFLVCGLFVNSIPSAMTLDAEGIVGSKGVAVTDVGSKGQIRLGAELWTAFSATEELIPAGTEVVVTSNEGLTVEVVRAA